MIEFPLIFGETNCGSPQNPRNWITLEKWHPKVLEYELVLCCLAIARLSYVSLRDETDSFHCSQYTASFEFIIFECTIGVDQGYHVVWVKQILPSL